MQLELTEEEARTLLVLMGSAVAKGDAMDLIVDIKRKLKAMLPAPKPKPPTQQVPRVPAQLPRGSRDDG